MKKKKVLKISPPIQTEMDAMSLHRCFCCHHSITLLLDQLKGAFYFA